MKFLRMTLVVLFVLQGCAQHSESSSKSTDDELTAFISETIGGYFPELSQHPVVNQFASSLQDEGIEQTESPKHIKDLYFGDQLESNDGFVRTPLESYLIQEFMVSTNLISLKMGEAKSFEYTGIAKKVK